MVIRKCIVSVVAVMLFGGGAVLAAEAAGSAKASPEVENQTAAKALPFDTQDKPTDRAGEVVGKDIENIGKRPHIRWLTNIGITYDTPPEKVRQAVRLLEGILADHEGRHPDFPPRVYFNGFNDWSLNIMVLLWYHPANYWDFQTFIQGACLEILSQFQEAGIDFASPSRTVYAARDDKRLLKLMLAGGGADAPTAPEP